MMMVNAMSNPMEDAYRSESVSSSSPGIKNESNMLNKIQIFPVEWRMAECFDYD